jgi:hypothetical protein
MKPGIQKVFLRPEQSILMHVVDGAIRLPLSSFQRFFSSIRLPFFIFNIINCHMESILEKFIEKAEASGAEVKNIIKEHGNKKIGEVTLSQIYQGMRGITGLVSETSLLDAQEGIRFRGYTIPELRNLLPKVEGGTEPMPEGLFYLMLIGELPSEEDAKNITAIWQRRSHVPTHVFNTIDALPLSTHPMTMFVTGVMALQTESKIPRACRKKITGATRLRTPWTSSPAYPALPPMCIAANTATTSIYSPMACSTGPATWPICWAMNRKISRS